jgi:hypothetical protein
MESESTKLLKPSKSLIFCYYPYASTREEYSSYLYDKYHKIKAKNQYVFADNNNGAIESFINCVVGSVECVIKEDKSQESSYIISKYMISLCEKLDKENGRQLVNDSLNKIKNYPTLNTMIAYAGLCSDDDITKVVYNRFNFQAEDLLTSKKEEFAKFIREFTKKVINEICEATILKLPIEVKNKKNNLEENQNSVSNNKIKPNSLKRVTFAEEIEEKRVEEKGNLENEPLLRKMVNSNNSNSI